MNGLPPVEFTNTHLREAMARDLPEISNRRTTALALLFGWEDSDGANLEKSLAELIELQIIEEGTDEWAEATVMVMPGATP
jgi:hypothetical protein